MKTRQFRLSSYLAPGDAFHIAHKPLAPAAPAEAHWHDYFELFLVEAGTCRHHLPGAQPLLSAGTLVFIRPADCHALSAAGSQPCRIVNIMFRPETAQHLVARYADDLAGRFFWADSAAPIALALAPAQLDQAMDMAGSLQTGPRSLARIESLLLSLMTEVADATTDRARAMPPWLARALDAARRPEIYRRGAAGLVEAAGRGHEHVCRQMRRHLGLTPSAYVNRVRMEQAATLLASGETPIGEIARHVGIENMSHFHRLFRGHHGLTPRAYRQRRRAAPF